MTHTPKPTRYIGLDPGPEQSAVVGLQDGKIFYRFLDTNNRVRMELPHLRQEEGRTILIVEKCVVFGGRGTFQSVLDTMFESGRMVQAWGRKHDWDFITRAEVKKHLCPKMKATDATIRRALIERFGGEEKLSTILRGIVNDMWSALAVAVTYSDQDTAEK